MAPTRDIDGDALVLRFVGVDNEGHDTQELQAAHVAEVLQGIVGLQSDFAGAGTFGLGPPSGLVVRPPREGSFIIEVVQFVAEHAVEETTFGVPSLATVLWWSTRSVRAEVEDFAYLESGNVKVKWQDKTVDEIPRVAWMSSTNASPGGRSSCARSWLR